jgi:type II secretory pathway component GspD/PulD (secretin)
MHKQRIIFILICFLSVSAHHPAFAYDIADIQKLLSDNVDERRISMDFKSAELADVLKIFSQQSGLNFISSTDVSDKKINLYLDNVPVQEALERILSANSLTYELDPNSNIFIVKTLDKPDKELMTRIYPLKFATVASSKLNSTLSTTGGGSSSSGGGTSAGGTAGAAGATGGTASSGSSGSSSTGIISSIRAILSGDGTVVEDPRTNSLIVTDIPAQFPKIEQVLAHLDIRIPQILIEVEMLDISKGTADLLGAKWGNTPVSFAGASKNILAPFNADNGGLTEGKVVVDDLDGTKSVLNPSNTASDVTTQYRLGSISFAGLSYALQFLNTQTDTRNLARPRILTLNNETAEIKIETDEAIQATTSTDQDANTVTTTVERSPTGVSLRVTPQANLLTREITLAVEPKVVEARASNISSEVRDPETRGSQSILRIKDGDTVVIGGLLRNDVTDIRTSVPVMSKIPLMGAAFRHKDKSVAQRELIIFITPHIVNENNIDTAMAAPPQNFEREQESGIYPEKNR